MGGKRKKLVSDSSGLPKYMQAYELLLSKIGSGEYPVGSKLMSCRKLAELFGISYLTVNQSLQKLVQDGIIRSQPGKGYFVLPPSPDADDGQQMQKVGFIVNTSGDMYKNYFDSVVRGLDGLSMSAVSLGNFAALAEMTSDEQQEKIRLYSRQDIKSLVIDGDRWFPFSYLKEIAENILQLVFTFACDSDLEFPGSNRILCDYRAAGKMAASHLLENGVERLAFLTYREMPETVRRRNGASISCTREQKFLDGIEDAYRELGRDFVEEVILLRDVLPDGTTNEAGMDQFLAAADGRRLGVASLGDYRLALLYRAAEKRGLVIGKDVLATGMYNTPWVGMLRPNVTSIRFGPDRIAELTLKAIVEEWRNVEVLIEPELFVRDSSCAESGAGNRKVEFDELAEIYAAYS